jgi:uncharacterized cofD-like protein
MARLKIVGLGGGTGLPVLLRGLRDFSPDEIEATAIVCATDNGGSTGRLRESFGIPAMGDLRNCLVALSGSESLLADLFQHRFSGGNGVAGNGLEGHALGNLIMTAMCQKSGSLGQAVERLSQLLPLRGKVLPVADVPLTLCAQLDDGAIVRGESQIGQPRRRIGNLWIEPGEPCPAPGVLEAIAAADVLVLGPGSLYTSLLPNLLVAGVVPAIRRSRAVKIFVCNLTTQPGETDGFSAADHFRAVEAYLGPRAVNFCLVNSRPIAHRSAHTGPQDGPEPVRCDIAKIASFGVIPIRADLAAEDGDSLRHDPAKLARLVVSLGLKEMAGRRRRPFFGPRERPLKENEHVRYCRIHRFPRGSSYSHRRSEAA